MSVSNIVVPVDFSQTAKTVTELAIDWSNILQCNVILLHNYRLIAESQNPDEPPRAILEKLIADKRKQFESFDREIGFHRAYSLSTKLELGFTIDSIKRMAALGEVDLIIYGVKPSKVTQSTSDLKKILDARLAPVLIISGDPAAVDNLRFEQLKTNIMTTDYEVFMRDFDRHLKLLSQTPNNSYLIHLLNNSPSSQSKTRHSSITDRIANFSR